MSIQTTIYISREEAEAKYIAKVTEQLANLKSISDDDLEESIDEHFYNYTIN